MHINLNKGRFMRIAKILRMIGLKGKLMKKADAKCQDEIKEIIKRCNERSKSKWATREEIESKCQTCRCKKGA